MTKSNTRKWWRARIKAIMGQALATDHDEWDDVAEGWLGDFMQTPELSLAELAESNPDYRLAVIHMGTGTAYADWTGDPMGLKYSIVQMEEK